VLTKRTAIGIGVGSVIIALSLASLVLHIGIQTIEVDETFGLGEFTSYHFSAPKHSKQTMKITGDKYDLKLISPIEGLDEGLQIPLSPHTNSTDISWVHLVDGESRIEIQNTGNSDLHVEATLQVTTDLILITYDIMVAITGVIIIGFSLGFSVRKPRGF